MTLFIFYKKIITWNAFSFFSCIHSDIRLMDVRTKTLECNGAVIISRKAMLCTNSTLPYDRITSESEIMIQFHFKEKKKILHPQSTLEGNDFFKDKKLRTKACVFISYSRLIYCAIILTAFCFKFFFLKGNLLCNEQVCINLDFLMCMLLEFNGLHIDFSFTRDNYLTSAAKTVHPSHQTN